MNRFVHLRCEKCHRECKLEVDLAQAPMGTGLIAFMNGEPLSCPYGHGGATYYLRPAKKQTNRITIYFGDGQYSFQRSEHGEVEVPEETLQLWEALDEMIAVQQRQLCALDIEVVGREEEQHFTKESARKIRWETES